MGSQFAWFYDVFTLAIICICIYVCGKRGFLRSVLMMLGYIVAIVFSYFFSGWVSPEIYESAVKPVVIEYITEKTENIDPIEEMQNTLNSKYGVFGINFGKSRIRSLLSEDREETMANISDYISEKSMVDITSNGGDEIIGNMISDEINEKFRQFLPTEFGAININLDDNEVWADVIRAIKGEESSLAIFVEEYIVRGIVISNVRLVVFILAFCILAIAVKVLSKVLKIVDHIPLVNSANTILGGAIGLIQGAMSVYVISLAVRLLISIGGNDMIFFNISTIEQTYLFRLFYNIRIF